MSTPTLTPHLTSYTMGLIKSTKSTRKLNKENRLSFFRHHVATGNFGEHFASILMEKAMIDRKQDVNGASPYTMGKALQRTMIHAYTL